jgi:hypothetical protein
VKRGKKGYSPDRSSSPLEFVSTRRIQPLKLPPLILCSSLHYLVWVEYDCHLNRSTCQLKKRTEGSSIGFDQLITPSTCGNIA